MEVCLWIDMNCAAQNASVFSLLIKLFLSQHFPSFSEIGPKMGIFPEVPKSMPLRSWTKLPRTEYGVMARAEAEPEKDAAEIGRTCHGTVSFCTASLAKVVEGIFLWKSLLVFLETDHNDGIKTAVWCGHVFDLQDPGLGSRNWGWGGCPKFLWLHQAPSSGLGIRSQDNWQFTLPIYPSIYLYFYLDRCVHDCMIWIDIVYEYKYSSKYIYI